MTGIMMAVSNSVASVEAPYTPPTPVTSNLFAWYDPKSETSYPGTGTDLFDLSGNNNDATIVGPTYDSNGYFTLDGTNDYIVSPNLYNGSGNEAHTVEVWVYPTASSLCVWSDMGENDPATTVYHFAGSQIIPVGPFNQAIAGIWNGTAIDRNIGGSGTILNTWNQIVRVFDGVGLYVYLNGVAANDPVALSWDSPWESTGDNEWYIAFGAEDLTTYSGSTANWFQSRYGITRFYTSALSASDVLSNYNGTKSVYGL